MYQFCLLLFCFLSSIQADNYADYYCIFNAPYETCNNIHENTQRQVGESQRQQAKTYSSNLPSELMHFAQQYDIDIALLTCSYTLPDQHHMQQEFISIMHAASSTPHNLARVLDTVYQDAIGKAASIGISANHIGSTYLAQQCANFCWAAVDCIQAIGEGIYHGARNTAHTLIHPIESAKHILTGISTITGALSRLVNMASVIGAQDTWAYVCATDPQYYAEQCTAIIDQLNTIANYTAHKIHETRPRDIIKHLSAFITENILWHQTFIMAYKLAEHILPIASEAAEYLTKEETLIGIADGQVMNGGRISSDQLLGGASSEYVAHVFNDIIEAVSRIERNRIHHIMAEKHAWMRIFSDIPTWEDVKNIIIKVMAESTSATYKNEVSKILQINQETVEFIYRVFENGKIVITNAWVKTR